MDGHGHGHATGEHRVPLPGQRVPALRARSVVPQGMAPEGPGWSSDHRPLCGRYRGRLPVQAGCGTLPPRRPRTAGSLRSSLHPDKTRLVEFGRFAMANRRDRGVGRPETFDFLGFTHFCTTTRRGRFRLGRKPVAKRVNRTLTRIDEVLRKRWHHDIWEVGMWLGRVYQGWLNYFAVPGSSRWIGHAPCRKRFICIGAARRESSRIPEREAADSILKHHHVHLHQAGLYLPRFFRKGNQALPNQSRGAACPTQLPAVLH